MLIGEDQVRLTGEELNQLRQLAARNNHAVNDVRTLEEAMEAHIKALPPLLAEDMLRFLETGSSELTKLPDAEAFWRRLSGA